MGEKEEVKTSVKQEQIHNLLFSREIGWQEIIYDLINTEQLDPWDIDITILSDKYLEKVSELEGTAFFVSSKVLLAASLLLRIKSEILLNKYIKSIDEILFGKKDEKKKYPFERIELEDEIPELIPRSPMPRFKKVTLKELIESLNKAIITENRRIKKEIINHNALRETSFSLPKRTMNIKDKIKEIYNKVLSHLNPKSKEQKRKVSYTELIGSEKEHKVTAFSPLLHLENQSQIWLDQEKHFDEIYIWIKEVYFKEVGDPFAELRENIEEQIEELDEEGKRRAQEVEDKFSEPIE
ncbi:MAG: segregation/condensation protein A [Nanoarchaeota archaeon]|nr:segregation/condensation protein A [Nanoarchaeota archaeon]